MCSSDHGLSARLAMAVGLCSSQTEAVHWGSRHPPSTCYCSHPLLSTCTSHILRSTHTLPRPHCSHPTTHSTTVYTPTSTPYRPHTHGPQTPLWAVGCTHKETAGGSGACGTHHQGRGVGAGGGEEVEEIKGTGNGPSSHAPPPKIRTKEICLFA